MYIYINNDNKNNNNADDVCARVVKSAGGGDWLYRVRVIDSASGTR